MLYGCDGHWWQRRGGVPEFAGIKISQDSAACALYRDLCKVEIPDAKSIDLLVEKPGVIGAGGNSGFQALNLTLQFGAMRILLVGFDMHATAGLHWHGQHGMGLNNPRDHNFVKWRRTLDGAASFLAGLGVDVVNGSPDSALGAYPKMTIEQAMRRWGL